MVEEQATVQDLIGKEELVRLALEGLDEEDLLRRKVEDAVRLLCADPACPVKPLSHDELDRLETLLEELREGGPTVFGEATTVSLNRIKLEVQWNPGSFPLADSLMSTAGGEAMLAARHAFGVIALAWQVQSHPRDVIITAGQFLRSIN